MAIDKAQMAIDKAAQIPIFAHATCFDFVTPLSLFVQAFQSRVAIGEEARQTMIWANQRLVISMARKFTGRGMDMPDLIAEGMTGLAKGVDRFDHTKGFKFSTYAHWWIRQAISRSLSEQGRMIRWDFAGAWGVATAAVQASAAARAHEKRHPECAGAVHVQTLGDVLVGSRRLYQQGHTIIWAFS